MQLLFTLCAAIAISAVISHLLAIWLRIETTTGRPWTVGASHGTPSAFVSGSSLAGDDISWQRLSAELGIGFRGWGVAGASPVEQELFQRKAPEVQETFIVISAYDMNEANLSDFRATVVPLYQTLKELHAVQARSDFSTRTIGQYPTAWLRMLFPTLGRSRGILGELREKLAGLIRPSATSTKEAVPTLSFDGEAADKGYKNAKISDWSEGRTLTRLAAMHEALTGEHSFDGPKTRALERMLQYGMLRGPVVVIVLPVSPLYTKEFLIPDVLRRFNSSLIELAQRIPHVQWVRLDHVPALASNDLYWDLVHMNSVGQQIATTELLTFLRQVGRQ